MSACREGRFHVFAVEEVEEALALLTGWNVGKRDEEDHYPSDSLLGLAEQKAFEYWLMASASATRPEPAETTEIEKEDVPEPVAAKKPSVRSARKKKS